LRADRRVVHGHAHAGCDDGLLHGTAAHRLAEAERLGDRGRVARALGGEHTHICLDDIANARLRGRADGCILFVRVERGRQQHLDRFLELCHRLVSLARSGEADGDGAACQRRVYVPFSEAGGDPREVCVGRLQALGQIAGVIEHVDAAGVHLQIVFSALVPALRGLIQLPIHGSRLRPAPL
jgi:hypothetical protein